MLLVLLVLEVFLNASVAQKYHDRKLSSAVSCLLRRMNQLNTSFCKPENGETERQIQDREAEVRNSLQVAVIEKDGSKYTHCGTAKTMLCLLVVFPYAPPVGHFC